MIVFLLALATLGLAALAPIIAAVVVLGERAPRRSRFAAWLGLSIGIGLVSAIPVHTLFVAVSGAAFLPAYKWAPRCSVYTQAFSAFRSFACTCGVSAGMLLDHQAPQLLASSSDWQWLWL